MSDSSGIFTLISPPLSKNFLKKFNTLFDLLVSFAMILLVIPFFDRFLSFAANISG